MKHKLLKYYLLFFILTWTCNLQAQNTDSLAYDYNSPVTVRSSEKINDFLNDEYYQYDKEIVRPSSSILQKILQWIGDFFRFIDRGGKPVSYIFYAIIFAILLFVIIKLLGFKYQGLFIRNKKIKEPELEVFDEDIHAINFSDIIDDAVKKGNYRTAVRYLYIKLLKVLTDNELIKWEINKTNKEYYKEMKNTKYFSVFKRLSFVYEYVWYGEFIIDKVRFSAYYEDFNKVFKEIK